MKYFRYNRFTFSLHSDYVWLHTLYCNVRTGFCFSHDLLSKTKQANKKYNKYNAASPALVKKQQHIGPPQCMLVLYLPPGFIGLNHSTCFQHWCNCYSFIRGFLQLVTWLCVKVNFGIGGKHKSVWETFTLRCAQDKQLFSITAPSHLLPSFKGAYSFSLAFSPAVKLYSVVLLASWASLSNLLRNTMRTTSRAACTSTNTNRHTCEARARSQYQ